MNAREVTAIYKFGEEVLEEVLNEEGGLCVALDTFFSFWLFLSGH
jgi:hypothetical protein